MYEYTVFFLVTTETNTNKTTFVSLRATPMPRVNETNDLRHSKDRRRKRGADDRRNACLQAVFSVCYSPVVRETRETRENRASFILFCFRGPTRSGSRDR